MGLGILLQPADGKQAIRLYYSMQILVQDGQAQKFCLGLKGDGGCRFCIKCANAISLKATAEDSGDDDSDHGVCSLTKKSQLRLVDDEEVFQSWDRLATRFTTDSTQAFALREKAAGFTFSPSGLLSSQPLRHHIRPISCYMHDWMHGVCANGTAAIVGFLFLEAMQTDGFQSWSSFCEYLAVWNLPALGKKACPDLASLFDTKRVKAHRKSKKLKMQASELLTVFPILAHYALTVCSSGRDTKPTQALLAMALFLELLTSVVYGCVGAADLDTAAEACLRLCLENGWQGFLVKKFHWLLHYGDALKIHKTIISCFTCERKHKQLLKVGTPIQNLKCYEKSVLEEVVSEQMYKIKQSGCFDFTCHLATRSKLKASQHDLLAKHIPAMFLDAETYTCNTLGIAGGGSLATGDVILLNVQDGVVCGRLRGNFECRHVFCLVQFFQLQSVAKDSSWAMWSDEDDSLIHAVQANSIRCALTWSKGRSGCRTLLPYHTRSMFLSSRT